MQSVPDHSYEWLSRLEQHTKGDPDLRLQYLEWMRTQKPKRQICVQPLLKWLDKVNKADFSDPLLAINFRRSLFSREVDYLEIAIDKDLGEMFVVLPEPGALPIYGYPVAELPETSMDDEGLQMHPAFLSLSILGDHSTDPEVQIPKLVLPVGRLVSVNIAELFDIQYLTTRKPEWHRRPPGFREEKLSLPPSESLNSEDIDYYYEELRREFWKLVKDSNIMKDTDYFVVIDVVTPGYPVWIIYNPDRGEDSADLTVTDLLQSTSKFPRLDSEPGFGAARILTGIKNWQSSYARQDPDLWPCRDLWPSPHLWPSPDSLIERLKLNLQLTTRYLMTIHTIKANILQTRIQYPVVGRLENMKIAERVLFKAQSR